MARIKLLAGERFERLTVVRDSGFRDKAGEALWLVQCECGRQKILCGSRFKYSYSRQKSCGCLHSESSAQRLRRLRFKHGGSRQGSPLYSTYVSWFAMKDRCYYAKGINYPDYGGRGIRVCDRWLGDHGFENFLADLGMRPKGLTLDRIDVNGNYQLANVRWATPKEQANNRRNSPQYDPELGGVDISEEIPA
jgi:hypothetical protein